MRNKYLHFIYFVIILWFSSCKRDKIPESYGYLVRKWDWTHTYKNKGAPGFEDITPTTDGNSYSIEISKKRIYFFKNGKQETRGRIKKIEILPGYSDTSSTTFVFYLTGKEGLILEYFHSRNYIVTLNFPYSSPAGDGITYENYYSK